jgi:heme-degrading monooxygenase HmoA
MFIVANRIPVALDWQDEFENRFRLRVEQMDQLPGFVSMQILKPESEGAPYVVLTSWLDENAFQAWIKSEDFKQAHQNPLPKEAYTGKPVMEKHQVVVST